MHGQTGDCVTTAVRRASGLAFAAHCVRVCIARTLKCKALGAVPAPVNQTDRKQNNDGALGNRSDVHLRAAVSGTQF